MRRLLAYAAIYIFWGGSFLAIRFAVAVTPPFIAAGFRLFVAGLILYAYGRYRGAARPKMRQWIGAACIGLFMFTVTYGCLFWSERFLSSGLAAVLNSLIPVWMLVAEWLAFRSVPIGKKALWGIVLGIAGVFLLAFPTGPGGGGLTKAALVLVLGTLFWSGGTVASLKVSLPREVTINAGLQMAWGGFFLLLLSGATGEFPRLARLSQYWDWRLALSMAYLIFAASILAFSAFVWLIEREPAARVASYAYVNPVIALLLGFALDHERPTALQYGGVVLVLASIFLALAGKRAGKREPVETIA